MHDVRRSISDREACQQAASLLAEGLLIGTYQRGGVRHLDGWA
jgi:hypothetical protein